MSCACVFLVLDDSILYDQDNGNDSIKMDEDTNCTEISCSCCEVNGVLVFKTGDKGADGDGDGDESHKEPESGYICWPTNVLRVLRYK